MTRLGHLWAVGYDDVGRANQLRDEIMNLGWNKHSLTLADVAIVMRHPDGSFMIDRESLPVGPNILGSSLVGLLAGLVIGAPLTGAAFGAMVGGRFSLGRNRRRLHRRSESADEARDLCRFRFG